MRVDPFPKCCGAFVINDFGNTFVTQGTKDSIDTDDIDRFLAETVEKYGANSAFILAILNDEQERISGKVFKKHGFKVRAKGKNRGHEGLLRTYIWIREYKE